MKKFLKILKNITLCFLAAISFTAMALIIPSFIVDDCAFNLEGTYNVRAGSGLADAFDFGAIFSKGGLRVSLNITKDLIGDGELPSFSRALGSNTYPYFSFAKATAINKKVDGLMGGYMIIDHRCCMFEYVRWITYSTTGKASTNLLGCVLPLWPIILLGLFPAKVFLKSYRTWRNKRMLFHRRGFCVGS